MEQTTYYGHPHIVHNFGDVTETSRKGKVVLYNYVWAISIVGNLQTMGQSDLMTYYVKSKCILSNKHYNTSPSLSLSTPLSNDTSSAWASFILATSAGPTLTPCSFLFHVLTNPYIPLHYKEMILQLL